MKNNERLLRVLGDVRDDLIPDAEGKTGRRFPIKAAAAGALAAAAVIAGVFILKNTGSIVDLAKEEWEDYRIYKEISLDTAAKELPKLSRGELNRGFEVELYRDFSEYESNNPWNEEIKLSALPVFKNLAYNSEGLPPYLDSEEEMTEIAEKAARALGISIDETERLYSGKNKDKLYGIKAICGGEPLGIETASIVVYGDRTLTVNLSSPSLTDKEKYGISLPDGYKAEYTVSDTDASREEAEKTAAYLAESFKNLLQFKNPVSYSYKSSYRSDASGSTVYRFYGAYDRRESVSESIVSYNLAWAEFGCSPDGRITAVYLNNYLSSAEYIGDYPVISPEEAKNKLIGGDYLSVLSESDVAGGNFEGEAVVKTELVYLNYRQEYFQPYYKFYVRLNREPHGSPYDKSLTPYGVFYVNAVTEEYLAEEKEEEPSEELPAIPCTLSDYPFSYTLIDHNDSGIRIASDISALEDSNPWNAESDIGALPVYEMSNLSNTQMNELLKSTAEKMGVTVTQSSFMKNQYPNADNVPYSILMGFCGGEYKGASDISITVYGTGDVEISFNENAEGQSTFKLPAEYAESAFDPAGTYSGSADILDYLAETFRDVVQPKGSYRVYSYLENSHVRNFPYEVFNTYRFRLNEESEDTVGKILNYNLAYTEFSLSEYSVEGVTLTNKLCASEKLGDYPIITAEEAKALLLDGKYLISFSKDYIKDGRLSENDVKKVDLVYRFSESRYLMPFYRFYAEIEAVPYIEGLSGLKEYGEFYVPAVKSDYIAGDTYGKERNQAVIDSFWYGDIPFPDGSVLSASEASETFGDTSSPGLIFDFGFLRYAKPVFMNSFDDPEIFDFSADSFNVPTESIIYYEPDFFKVRAGDVLENGMTVKSASYGVERTGGMSVRTSKIALEGEATLNGILFRKDGLTGFYPDPTEAAVPLIADDDWNTLSDFLLPDYYRTSEEKFAIVTGGGAIYSENDFNAGEKEEYYIKGRLTLKDVTLLVSDRDVESLSGVMFPAFETAEFVSFEEE